MYAVQVFVPGNYADTERAVYQIYHDNQTSVYTLSQNSYWTEWVNLGVYTFTPATASYVKLTDVTYEDIYTNWVAFDAVAFVPQIKHIYLPLVMRNWPVSIPIKRKLGIHLGNHENDTWTDEMLLSIDGGHEGIWPSVIVVQSKQLWHIDRFPSGQGPSEKPDCSIAGARPIEARNDVHEYLGRAMENGVKVIIRIAPSPGNFVESILPGWPDPTLVPTRTILTLPRRTPESQGYCYPNYERFRAIDDIAEEMDAIHDVMASWPEDSYYFEPANEPNIEWYGAATKPAVSANAAWGMMDAYFAALMTYIQVQYPELQVLTPPMSQAQYAEGIEWMHPEDPCKLQLLTGGLKGYEVMQSTYEFKTNWYSGYSWHNYYTLGRESYQACSNGGFHVSYHFPDAMNIAMIINGHPGFVTEMDLCSWSDGSDGWEGQCFNSNTLQSKQTESEATSASLRYFVATEQPANAVALWLLHNDEVDREEYDWHEAYDSQKLQPHNWFSLLWNADE